MIAHDSFVSVFGMVAPGDDDLLARIVSNAVRSGYAIVLDKPSEKVPMCILNARSRNAADRAAQEEARLAGDMRWHSRKHACGINHALTVASLTGSDEAPTGDEKKVAVRVGALIKRLQKELGGRNPNIGVELGRSRMIVVDMDTTEQREAFISLWEHETRTGVGDPGQPDIPGMTVKSPGKRAADGTWIHQDGGHFWLTIPDGVELPSGGGGALTAESGWTAMWADHQVLVPPSSRAEGAYEITGQVNEAPAWLIEMIFSAARGRMERASARGVLPDGSGDIDRWATGMPWSDLLEPDGWVATGLPDGCTCPVYTAPGAHASPKSATAHDLGCDRYDVSPGHAPLHVWTDNPPEWLAEAIRTTGRKTFTKLSYLAHRDHEGVLAATLGDLGLNVRDEEFPGFGVASAAEFSPLDLALAKKAADEAEIQGDDEADEPDDEGLDVFDTPRQASAEGPAVDAVEEPTRAEAIRSLMISSADLDLLGDPEPLVDGFLDLDTIARMTGKSGHGKSFVMLDMAASVAMGKDWHGHRVRQGMVVYMVAEGTRGWKRRMRAWEKRYNDGQPLPAETFLILPLPIQVTSEDWHPFRMALEGLEGLALVVLDTQARVTVGVDENDATEMGKFVERMEQVRRGTGACVLTVHHLGHNGEHGRGSTAVLGALGSEIRVKKTTRGFLTVETEKQKDAEEASPLKFKLEKVVFGDGHRDSSVVPVPDGWVPADPADPFSAPESIPSGPGVDESSRARDRLAAVVWVVFSHGRGATKAEALKIVTSGHPVYGSIGQSQRYAAWADLEREGVLVQQTSATGALTQRYKLHEDEAHRLGLPRPQPLAPPEESEGSVDE